MHPRQFIEAQRRHQKGDIQGALRVYRSILEANPDDGRSRLYYALALQQLGNVEASSHEAFRAFQEIDKPTFADYSTLGIINKGSNRASEAIAAFEEGLRLSPGHPGLLSNLATTYFAIGQIDQAESRFKELLTKLPEDAAPSLNLARICLKTGRIDEAQSYLLQAKSIDPSHPDYLALQANLYILDADHTAAFKLLLRLLEKLPAHREGWRLLRMIDSSELDIDAVGRLLKKLASTNVDSARVLAAGVGVARQNLVWEDLPHLEAQLQNALLSGSDVLLDLSSVFDLLATNVSQQAHLAAATHAWKIVTGASKQPLKTPTLSAGGKMNVGILSSDLREHAIGHLIAGLIESLPKGQFKWVAYSNSVNDGGIKRARFRSAFDAFTSVVGLNDAQLAELIREDGIDLLIDLNGMTTDTRSPVLALRPAPIQIQWLGMPGTLGAGSSVDYVIVDKWVVDDLNAEGFSEALLVLPRSYQPNDHEMPDFSVCPTRDSAGLPSQGFIFGCFNQYYKISPDTFDLWMKILEGVPNSYLWMLEPKTETLKERFLGYALKHGIEKERFIFADQKSQKDHIARLQWMDLVLDTWPYNAHTTCSDAVRSGVPVITMPGDTFASRVAAGILETAGLHEWNCSSAAEYLEKAIAFGKLPRKDVDHIKAQIKSRYWESPMVDNKLFAAQLTSMFLQLRDHHLAGGKIKSFELTDELLLRALPYGRNDEATIGSDTVNRVSPAKVVPASLENRPSAEVRNAPAAVAPSPTWIGTLKKGGPQSRLANLAKFKSEVLTYEELPLVIDVGAADFNSAIGYEALVSSGLARALGFEPDPDSFDKLSVTSNAQYLPTALGDGESHKLSICNAPGMNSILEPRREWLGLFPMFSIWGTVNSQTSVQTARLDDIEDAANARFMKMDIQGAEMLVLENGERVLSELSLLQIEASPTPLYHGEASLWEVGKWLSDRGFVLHCFSDLNKRRLKPFGKDDAPFLPSNQLFQVDAVFMPDPLNWDELSDSRLLSLAFFAHAMYRSHDVAMLAMQTLDKRDNGKRVERYRQYLDAAGLDA